MLCCTHHDFSPCVCVSEREREREFLRIVCHLSAWPVQLMLRVRCCCFPPPLCRQMFTAHNMLNHARDAYVKVLQKVIMRTAECYYAWVPPFFFFSTAPGIFFLYIFFFISIRVLLFSFPYYNNNRTFFFIWKVQLPSFISSSISQESSAVIALFIYDPPYPLFI